MSETDKEQEIENLIMLYCEGKASDKECDRVEAWINESATNASIAKDVYNINRSLSDIEILQKINTDKALKKVHSEIKRKKTGKIILILQRIAAVLFIPLLSLYLVQLLNNNKEELTSWIEVSSNAGTVTKIFLPDSTLVYLNSKSSIRYPENFSGNERTVFFNGEGLFEVKHNKKKPFVVHLSNGTAVEVLGTTFNIESFDDDNRISTTLVEGKVNMRYHKGGKAKKTVLLPGQKIVFDKKTEAVKLYNVDSAQEIAWKDGKLIFDNTPMHEVICLLQKHFNVTITIKDKEIESFYFTGNFTEPIIDPILQSFKISSKINWRYVKTTGNDKQTIELYLNK